MVRILSLLWTLVAAFVASSVSFFYLSSDGARHGFPFVFAHEFTKDGVIQNSYNVWSYVFDVVFWWFLFSILWIMVKNYVFETD
ncbi:MAG: hypothetical protein A3F35_01815 [Candidatus Woykebacteria bacterium RIFCSPHIGHO2_12_FULL_45_10]|uniref:Uncharacterized protein n=1 Tax=Candidatus Woykebacteria bacterium RIFCSPHIGHO2_12_FULL_45_10 TaxID=1802603 RepID=A0A1G1WSX5_9BACT|nr:MAG: hypothetical protein A3F35_01815 [Candidatus Woykebacteria bacterium RIFCSPHIGHO2_12_FULL_45_10]